MRGYKYLPVLILFGTILAWRFVQIRNLVLPVWVDSVHHALLVRILLEQGTVPTTWEPYLPQVPFYYHFGFHLTAALLAKLTGLTVGWAVLAAGQVWQAVLTLGVYLLGYALWKNQAKALAAMILVGFVSQMPAYYTTWGRYTLLAGLTLMIMGMAAALAKQRVILALLVAATIVSHYYAFFLLTLFLIALIITHPTKRTMILWGWLGGILIALPWLWRVLAQVYRHHLAYVQTGAESIGYSTEYLWYLLGPGRNYVLLLLALLGGVAVSVYLIKGRTFTRSTMFPLLCWTFIIVGLMGPWRLGPFRPDHHAAIVLFLPVSLLAVEGIWHLRKPVLIWGTVLILVVWGVWETKDLIKPDTVLATKDDVAALEWISTNTPQNANFLIDVAPWSAQWRGTDGGWWITPFTGRQTVLPPAAYGWGGAESVRQIRAIAARIYGLSWFEGLKYCRKLTSLMAETDATYYYTRSKRLEQCPTLQQIYQGGDGIAIYQLDEGQHTMSTMH